MKKKSIAILVATTLVMTSVLGFTGCGNSDTTKTDTKVATKFTGEKIFKDTNGKAKTLNPHVSTMATESEMMDLMGAPLTKYFLNDKNEPQEYPVMAKELPKISEDKTVLTYKLRENLKFSDGTPIDADTYIYSFQKVLDPVMQNYRASSYMEDVAIKNSQKYFEGKCKWEDVGIKALDKYTLQFTLEFPMLPFQSTGTINYDVLVNPKLYDKYMAADKKSTKYGTSFETIDGASYGPYTLKEWSFDQSYKMEKNKDFPVADMYIPDKYEARVVEEAPTLLQLFEGKEIDTTTLVAASYDKYKEDPRLLLAPTDSISQMNINKDSKTNPILGDINFRKAMFHIVDREKIAKDIVKSAIPAAYIVPKMFYFKIDDKITSYRDTEQGKANVVKNYGFDKALAKEYFDKAYAANGNKKVTVTISYADTSDVQKARTEFLKNTAEEVFGKDRFEMKLQAVPAQVTRDNLRKGTYEIGYDGWQGGYKENTPTKFQTYTSKFPDKTDQFVNEEFDKLYDRCTKGDLNFDEKGKLEATAKLEKMMLDDCSIIPMFESTELRMFSDKLVLRNGKKYDMKVGYATMQADFTR